MVYRVGGPYYLFRSEQIYAIWSHEWVSEASTEPSLPQYRLGLRDEVLVALARQVDRLSRRRPARARQDRRQVVHARVAVAVTESTGPLVAPAAHLRPGRVAVRLGLVAPAALVGEAAIVIA